MHRDLEWNYSFWTPLTWQRYDMQDQYGFIYSPGEDSRTGFCVSVRDLSDVLDGPVTEEDLPVLREGMMEGLMRLPNCQILEEKEISKGYAVGFEVLLTFEQDGETLKRKMRLLYNDRQQFTIYGQAVSLSEYKVFGDTFEFMYMSFAFGDLLGAMGAPATPENVVKWEGGGKDVQTKPRQLRDHGVWRRKTPRKPGEDAEEGRE
jgi:hypothetical protein